jgi:hypothetical protein
MKSRCTRNSRACPKQICKSTWKILDMDPCPLLFKSNGSRVKFSGFLITFSMPRVAFTLIRARNMRGCLITATKRIQTRDCCSFRHVRCRALNRWMKCTKGYLHFCVFLLKKQKLQVQEKLFTPQAFVASARHFPWQFKASHCGSGQGHGRIV